MTHIVRIAYTVDEIEGILNRLENKYQSVEIIKIDQIIGTQQFLIIVKIERK